MEQDGWVRLAAESLYNYQLQSSVGVCWGDMISFVCGGPARPGFNCSKTFN